MVKRKSEAEAAELVTSTSEEVNFPRGGASVLTPLEHREISNKVAKDLFSTKKSSTETESEPATKKRKASKKDAKNSKSTGDTDDTDKRVMIEDLSFKKLTVGSIVLGCVTQINDLNILVALPNQLVGTLPITEISDVLTKQVEAAAAADEDEDEDMDNNTELPDLNTLFHIGQWVPCSITSVQGNDSGKKRIELSLKPSIVNSAIAKVDIVSGLVIGASVESVEDHGYVMSMGVEGMTGFCRHADAKSFIEKFNRGEELAVGQYVVCAVKDVAKNKRTVNLSFDRQSIGSARIESPYSKMNSITSGQRISGLVEYAGARGLKVKFMGLYEGYIGISQLPFTTDVSETYRVGSSVTFRILFSDMVTEQKLILGSLLPHVVKLDQPKTANDEGISKYVGELYPYGAFLEKVTVVRVTPIGVVVSIDGLENVMGFIHISQLSDERIESLSKKTGNFIVGSTHRARVLSYSPVDGVLSLTTKPSILKDAFLQLSDVVVGEVVDCTVDKLTNQGLVVKLSSRISGFVPSHHLADVKLSRPELKFKAGGKVRARVLMVDNERNKLVLTLKKSLLKTDLPLIKSSSDAKPKMATHGIIVNVLANGCIVGFYNNVTAFCPGSEMTEAKGVNLQEAFQKGQTVKVYVLSVEPEKQKMMVSMIRDTILTDAERDTKKNKKGDNSDGEGYQPGSIVDGVKVTDVKNMQLSLKMPNGSSGRVHITEVFDKFEDIPADQRQHALEVYKDKSLKVKVMQNRSVKKHTHLALSHAHKTMNIIECTLKLDDKKEDATKHIKSGDVILGFVTDVKRDHLLVAINHHLKGMVRKQHTSTSVSVANHLSKHFVIGQAVKVSVTSVNNSKKTLDLVIVDGEAVPPVVKDIKSLKVGQVLNGLVRSVDNKTGLLVQLTTGVAGRVHLTDLSDIFVENPTNNFKENTVVKCKVLGIDVSRKRVDLTLRPSCISNVPVNTEKKHQREIKSFDDLHEGDVLKGYVENISNVGVFVAYNRHIRARVKIAQLSDDFVKEWKSLYTVGELVESKVLNVEADLKRVEASLKKSVVTGIPASKKKSTEEEIPDVDDDEDDEESEDEPMEGQDDDSSDEDEDESMNEDESDDEQADQADDVEMTNASEDDEDDSDEEDDDDENAPALSVGSGFDWSGQVANLQGKGASDDEDSDSENDDESADKKKKGANKKKEVEDKTAELNASAPQSIGDFERLLVGSPDSSYLWINYMAYQLQLSEISKARAIGDRALKTINFREEQEKMNVWVALMNLENQFGTDATLEQIFKRALTFCDPKKVYLQLAKVYERSEKMNKAEDLWKEATKKFGQSPEVWTQFGLFYLQQGNVEGARDLLQRSLKSLPKHEHIQTIVKFAQMEFKHGEAERGRTIMEGVMNNSPKRMDLWNIYLDMEIKAGEHDMVQRLFERVTSMKFSSKKMKFLFKKWLQYAKDHGSADDAERVKERTLAYVESINA
ncbi:hypothetical protein BCR42DRAFT_427544 [Absidia repens]|uniref:Protein RRP5 homolog n=1 Tax=Absidia repens TaxID=90262 RepID=A0A1X2HZR2_9FUNG|nr:hypothetical protein BCR42DRAFT_427544 [Absidia repens]